MRDDALHKKNATPAAKLQQNEAEPLFYSAAAQAAARDFFTLWQSALRDAASLKDLLPDLNSLEGSNPKTLDGIVSERKSDV